jgi:hypothetical protein
LSSKIWKSGRRWKRLVFLFWVPLVARPLGAWVYAFWLFYVVHVESNVFLCHRDFAGYDVRRDFRKILRPEDVNDEKKVQEYFNGDPINDAGLGNWIAMRS